jgi:hypothetical protein
MNRDILKRSVALASLLFAAAFAGAQPNGPLPQPLPLFPADNWWNVDISAAPLDPGSAGFLQRIGTGTALHPDFGGDADTFPETYGIPYVSVPGTQPLVPVTFVEFGDESDAGAPGRPPGYPIPEEAKTQPHYIEGGYPGNANVGGDRHMLIMDRDHRILFELYHTHFNAALNRWEAGSGAVFPLTNARRREGWTSADAAGLAILPGLVRYDEVFGPDPIRHAFRFTIEATNSHVFPASHDAGEALGALPMGARLRLKASKNLSGYPPEIRKIFQAMKTYGLIVADNGSDMFIQGTYDARWNNDVLNPAFASLHASDFEVVQLGWQPSAPAQPCVPSDQSLCLNDGRFEVKAEWTRSNGQMGTGHAVRLTADTGYFWFFFDTNIEVVVKVLKSCDTNNRYWVFAGGLTDVRVRLNVRDSVRNVTKEYTNPQGTPFRPIQDTGAFATCP